MSGVSQTRAMARARTALALLLVAGPLVSAALVPVTGGTVASAPKIPRGPVPNGPEDPGARPASVYDVPLRLVDPGEYRAVFDERWVLPAPPADDDAPDLIAECKRLAAERWPGDDDARFLTVGDLAAEAALVTGASARRRLLAAFRVEQPAAWRRWGALLEQVLMDDGLRDPEWSSGDDADDDGMFVAEAWSLEDEPTLPWRDLSGNEDVHQAAAWVLADIEALRRAENDYAALVDVPDRSFDVVYPLRGSHVGLAGEGEVPARVALQVQTRSDLPWPFGDLSCLMRIQYRVDGDGHLVTDVASTSSDFHWFAGRDVAVPIATRDGVFTGLLVVRWFGFDVRGVPEGGGTRRAALRDGLGRLKRGAEARWRAREEGTTPLRAGVVPPFEVLGDRRLRR